MFRCVRWPHCGLCVHVTGDEWRSRAGRDASLNSGSLLSLQLSSIICSHNKVCVLNAKFVYAIENRKILINVCVQFLFESMVLAALYVWCQLNREVVVQFWFGLQFKAVYLPWVLAAFNFVLAGEYVPLDILHSVQCIHISVTSQSTCVCADSWRSSWASWPATCTTFSSSPTRRITAARGYWRRPSSCALLHFIRDSAAFFMSYLMNSLKCILFSLHSAKWFGPPARGGFSGFGVPPARPRAVEEDVRQRNENDAGHRWGRGNQLGGR